MHIELSQSRVRRILCLAGALVALAGVAVEILYYTLQFRGADILVPLLSLSYEANLPTWYMVCLLAACALVLAILGACEVRERRAWWALAVIFTYISLDELVQLHEHAGGWLGTGGILYFDWVIPAAVVVAVLGVMFLGFLRRLPARRRWQLIAAGSLYVGGALLMELPLGYWTERAGTDNLVYALIDAIEESLEIAGVSVFLAALLEHCAGTTGGLRIAIEAPASANITATHGPDKAVVPEMHDRHDQGNRP